jgi:DNA-binding LytR/AlgR family response regulator
MSRQITCLVIDDEPSAQKILEQYINDTPQLKLLKTCNDALQAREFLDQQSADLLFLDINMPKLSGISFLNSMPDPPAVILATAYDDYALKGYELDVVDYLLKPFSFERFLLAISKVEDRISDTAKTNHLFIKADKKTYRIDASDIIYVESMGDYVTIYTGDQRITTYETLQNMEGQLPDSFLRIHKSYIISLEKVDYLEGNRIVIDGKEFPIGGTFKEEVKKHFTSE